LPEGKCAGDENNTARITRARSVSMQGNPPDLKLLSNSEESESTISSDTLANTTPTNLARLATQHSSWHTPPTQQNNTNVHTDAIQAAPLKRG
jgi:hypothetical protein